MVQQFMTHVPVTHLAVTDLLAAHLLAAHLLAAIQYPHIDPVIVRIGPVAIRWYGLAYVSGFALAYFWLSRMIKWGRLWITQDQLSDLVTWLILGVLLGGRLGWWLVYHRAPADGRVEPWYEPIALWHGGMSFHGGLVGVILGLLIWQRSSRANFWNMADCLALVTPVGLCFGRIANFINAELVGRPTDVPWGVIFPGDHFARHPSQLYEATLEGPVLLGSLWLINRFVRNRQGVTAGMFLVLYGIFRFFVEFTREPDVQIGFIAWGWLTMGQLLSVLLALVGVAICVMRRKITPAPTGGIHGFEPRVGGEGSQGKARGAKA